MNKKDRANLRLLKVKQSKQIAANEEFKRELPAIIESTKLVAKLRAANYKAHIDEGFTPDQALELCKTVQI